MTLGTVFNHALEIYVHQRKEVPRANQIAALKNLKLAARKDTKEPLRQTEWKINLFLRAFNVRQA